MAQTKGELVEQFRCQAIREAAMRMVARKGYDSVTVQDIADEAGIAKGTVYLYFKSREDVLDKTVTFAFDELRAHIREAIDGGGTFRECIERVVQTQLDFFEQRREFFRLYLAVAEPLGERRLRKHTCYLTHISQLASMVEAAAARGEVSSASPERIAVALASVIRDIGLQRLMEKTKPPLADDVAFVRDFICRGIAANERSENP